MCSAHRPADDPSIQLTGSARDRIEAVVFDANAYGMARPDLERLERLAGRLAGIGIQTWIPEPVMWEWAEHVACDWEAVKNAARQERDRMKRAGIPVAVPTSYDSRQSIIDAVLTNVRALPHVQIIELSGGSAVEGLKDQVLQRKPGKTKGGSQDRPGSAVKTGASDSAWLRDVLNRTTPGKIIIVGADRDINAAFTAWGKPSPLTRALNELQSTLFEVTVDDGHAQSSIVRYLLKQLPADTVDSDGSGFDIGHIAGLETAITNRTDGDGSSLSVYGASVTRLVALAGVGEVSIEADDDSAPRPEAGHARHTGDLKPVKHTSAYATVYFLAEGEATVQTLYNGGDPEVSVLRYDNVLVRADLSFHFADGAIIAVTAEAEAEATLVDFAYDDDTDALYELNEALAWVPGLALEVGPLTYADSPQARARIHGVPTQITATLGPKDDAWELDLALGRPEADDGVAQLEVACTYDPSSWYGGHRDGFQGPDAYQVAVSAPGVHDSHGLWSVPAWIISKADWSAFEAPDPPQQPVAEES